MLPKVELGEVRGLIKEIKNYEGQVDIATISDELVYDVDEILPVIDTAEALGFIVVDEGNLRITEEGYKFLECEDHEERKKLVRQQLLKNEHFKKVLDELRKKEEVTREELEDVIMKIEVVDKDTLDTLVDKFLYYGVYSDLLEYDSREGKIKIGKETGTMVKTEEKAGTEVRELTELEKELAILNENIAKLEELYKKGEVDEEAYKKLKEEYESKKKEIEEKMKRG